MGEHPDKPSHEELEAIEASLPPVYRDDDAFNTAMDAAAAKLDTPTSTVVGHVIWWSALAFQAFLFLSKWAFGWDARREMLPGVDLTKPMWVLIIGMVVLHHVTTRGRHARIIADRLCLECAAKLKNVPVDADECGTCPSCGHSFRLGDYRRPSENRGVHFRGYIDEAHFDAAMDATAERIRENRGLGLEGKLIGWGWTLLAVGFGLLLLFGYSMLEWVPVIGEHPYAIWGVLMLIWTGTYMWRCSRLQRVIPEQRLCFECGFSLLRTPVDENGMGRCSECGEVFDVRQYERPEDEA